MFLSNRFLSRPFRALSASVILLGVAFSATRATAQESGECQAATIVSINHGAATDRSGKLDRYAYRTALCVSPDGQHIVYGQDFDLDKQTLDKLPMPPLVRKYLVQTNNKLSAAQRDADLDEVKAHINSHSPVTAALPVNLPVIDATTGDVIAPNLDPAPIQLSGARLTVPAQHRHHVRIAHARFAALHSHHKAMHHRHPVASHKAHRPLVIHMHYRTSVTPRPIG